MNIHKRLTQSESVVALSFLVALGTILSWFVQLSLAWKIGLGAALLAGLGWFLYEFLPRKPFPAHRSGIQEFRPGFEVDHTKEVLEEAEREFCYFGISFSAIWPEFKTWHNRPDRNNVRVKLLLANPGLDHVLADAAEWEAKPEAAAQCAQLIRERIEHTLRELTNLNSSSIEIRLHSEQCREWMYYLDGKKFYVGLVRKGSERHHNPVLVVTDRRKDGATWNLFDQYQQFWQAVWDKAAAFEPSDARPAPASASQVPKGS